MLLGKYYSDSSRDNVKRRFAQMLHDEIWPHKAPFGYKNVQYENPRNRKRPEKGIVIDEEKAQFVERTFYMRIQGASYAMIAKKLNAEGCTTHWGKKMTKNYIERIINNKFYCGTMTHLGKE